MKYIVVSCWLIKFVISEPTDQVCGCETFGTRPQLHLSVQSKTGNQGTVIMLYNSVMSSC